MSKQQQPKKRVVAPVAPQPQQRRTPPAPARGGSAPKRPSSFNQEMIFGPRNYQIMMIGLGLIVLGLLLMLGGRMPSPDVWQPEIIYSSRRITLAPLSMLLGFGVILYGIFYDGRSTSADSTTKTESTEQPEA